MIEFKLVMLVMASAMVYGAWTSWRQARRTAASRSWPAAKGSVECSEPVRTRTSRGLLIYEPRIEYAYRGDGRAACPELACLECAEGSVALAYAVPVIFAVGSTTLFWYVLPTL